MRPGDRQRDDLATNRLCADIVQMICAPDRATVVKADAARILLCEELGADVRRCCQQLASGASALIRILVTIVPKCCRSPASCGDDAQPVETWTIQLKQSEVRPLPAHFLVQAIRSHLAFSQLSSWLASAGVAIEFKPVFRITSWARHAASFLSGVEAHDWHEFPRCSMPAGRSLRVRVRSSQCRSPAPVLKPCPCAAGWLEARGTVDDDLVMLDEDNVDEDMDGPQVDETVAHAEAELQREQEQRAVAAPKSQSPARRIESVDMLDRNSGQQQVTDCQLSAMPRQSPNSTCRENYLFGSNYSSDQSHFRPEKLIAPSDDTGMRTPPRPTQLPVCTPPTPDRRRSPVNFWVGGGAAQSPGVQPHSATQTASSSTLPSPTSPTNTGKSGRRRRRSQKILFSSGDISVTNALDADMGADDSQLMDIDMLPSTSAGLPAASCDGDHSYCEKKPSLAQGQNTGTVRPQLRPTARRERDAQRNLRQTIFERFRFGPNGLPLTSSPVPLKRNQHSFDFDASLCSVTGLRGALYGVQPKQQQQQQQSSSGGPAAAASTEHYDSGSSDSECGVAAASSPCCKSAPASSHLLGNFEESALNGRIKPFGSLEGFTLDLAASGAFCPPHVCLPVATVFFNLNDDNAPLPFLGMCNFEALRKKAYHVPKKGTIQATLFNPNGTVVKMFVVRYDVSDMPSHAHTVIRQRTFFMPQTATLVDARQNKHWLRYLIHLRLATSRSSRLYLHTDIRMLFSRKSELDGFPAAAAADRTDIFTLAAGSGADTTHTCELRSFTEMPNEPRYSIRQIHSV